MTSGFVPKYKLIFKLDEQTNIYTVMVYFVVRPMTGDDLVPSNSCGSIQFKNRKSDDNSPSSKQAQTPSFVLSFKVCGVFL